MKPYTDLTARQKARRLHRLAIQALEAYDLKISRVSLLGRFTNTLFRVRTRESGRYVVRVCTPGWRTDTDLNSEVLWLEALDRDTDLGAPVPLRARDGRAFVTAEADGVPEPRRCMVMSWIPGVPLGKRLTPANLEHMGTLHARMHAFGAAFQPPEGFTTRRMSSYLARDEPEVLFAESSADAFAGDALAVLMEVRERVQQAYEELYADAAGLRVIHNDLWHDNIKVDRRHRNGCGGLRPLDFEDTVWGYPVQDLAAAIQDLADAVPAESLESAVAALQRGYERVAPWPERVPGEIDVFRAGRALWVANYVAGHQREHLHGHVNWLVPKLRQFLAERAEADG